MKNHWVVVPVVLLFALGVFAESNVIGIAVSQGQLEVNKAVVQGNANLSAGAVIKTSSAPSRLRMVNGSNIILDRNSEVKVLSDRVVLTQGVSQFGGRNAYQMEALGFRVSPEGQSQARVEAAGNRVIIAALTGPVRVSDRTGMPVAHLTAGRALSFEPAAAASPATSVLTGRLGKENGAFVLPDEVSGLKVEVNGNGLDREVGQRVQISGTARSSADGSTQIVEVARLNRLTDDASPSPDPGPGAPNPAPPQGGSTMSNGAKVAIVLGAIAAVGITAGVLATQSR